MTTTEFNQKYIRYLEPGHYGLAIEDPLVINYLDFEFAKEIKQHASFSYAQVKTKFGSARCYTSSDKDSKWEAAINKIMQSTKV